MTNMKNSYIRDTWCRYIQKVYQNYVLLLFKISRTARPLKGFRLFLSTQETKIIKRIILQYLLYIFSATIKKYL